MVSTGPGPNTPRAQNPEDEYILSFGDILRMLWRRLWLIALSMLLFLGAALGYSSVQRPTYEASIKLWVGQAQERDASETNLSASDVQGLQILTITVAEAIDTRRVAEAVIEESGVSTAPGELMNDLSVEPIPETQFVRVKYEDPDPLTAQRIANAYGEVSSDQVSEISSDASAVTATMWDPATLPDEDNIVNPKPARDALLALVLGTMVGISLAFVLESLDDRLRSAEHVARASGAPVVGTIPGSTTRIRKKT